jgi:hypothetical protein
MKSWVLLFSFLLSCPYEVDQIREKREEKGFHRTMEMEIEWEIGILCGRF